MILEILNAHQQIFFLENPCTYLSFSALTLNNVNAVTIETENYTIIF